MTDGAWTCPVDGGCEPVSWHLVPTAAQLAHLVDGVYQVQRGGAASSFIELPVAG